MDIEEGVDSGWTGRFSVMSYDRRYGPPAICWRHLDHEQKWGRSQARTGQYQGVRSDLD